MTQPDFLIIGAMKCGTTTLAVQLALQEGIFVTTPKEPNYFSDDEVYAKGRDWYANLFSDADARDIKGEASTHYTKRPDLPNTIARMTAQLSSPRLVYMIRNPMARIVSHYIHEWSEGRMSGSLEQALADCPALVDFGRFGYQIEPFVEAFGAQSILLTSLEKLKSDPDGELNRVARHIGFDGRAIWMPDSAAQNVSAERVRRLPLQGLIVDNPVATALRRTLVPKALRTRIRQSRQMKARPEIPTHLRPDLQARFMEDRKILERYFPGDPSIELVYAFDR